MPLPLSIVIFGATGDLTGRKLVPALFQLQAKRHLPADTRILGVARSPLSGNDFRDHLLSSAREIDPALDVAAWREFLKLVEYVPADAGAKGGLEPLAKWLQQREGGKPGDRLYYLSVAPELYPAIATNLGTAGLSRANDGFRRMIVEKPFGADLASATELNRVLLAQFDESQIYRIDHYL